MKKKIDIHKVGGVLLRNKKFLVTRSQGKDFFIAPGGKMEEGETVIECLIRELQEELSIEVQEEECEKFGTFYAQAAGQEDKFLQMDVFIVKGWHGKILPTNEIKETKWIDSDLPSDFELGSIFEHDVLPELKKRNLIN